MSPLTKNCEPSIVVCGIRSGYHNTELRT